MGEARPLFKCDDQLRIERLELLLADERARRKAAEAQVGKFHALLIQARVALINAKPEGNHDD